MSAPSKKTLQKLPLMIADQSLALATSAFGLVAALAWNEMIKTIILEYVQPYLGKDGGLISQAIYALVVTTLAVTVTLQLTKLKESLELKQQEFENKEKQAKTSNSTKKKTTSKKK